MTFPAFSYRNSAIGYAATIAALTISLAPAHAQSVLVIAARYLDVDRGVYISPASILIEDDTIAAINPAVIPDNTRRIDLGSMTVLPGLMDAHTHLTFSIEPGWETEPVRWTQGDFALRGAVSARRTLEAGFTTVRDLGAPGFSDVALARAIDRGWIPGPRLIPAAHSLGVTGGHCDVTGWGPGILEANPERGIADGADELTKAARYQIKHGAKVIKFCATAGVLSFENTVGAQQLTAAEMKALVDEAHRHDLKAAAHAHGTEGIIAAAEAGVDSIEHGSVLTEEAASVLKKYGVYFVPTLYISRSIDWSLAPPELKKKGEEMLPRADESFKLAMRRGVKIAFGTDSGVFPHGDNAKELTVRVELGQTPIDAIRSATIITADLFGVDDRGRIREGLLADIIAVDGDPLADIRALEDVDFVMKGGAVITSPAAR